MSSILNDRVENYLLDSDNFYGWFWDTYARSDDKTSYVSVRRVEITKEYW